MPLSESTHRVILTIVLVMGTLMQMLDMTIANVALPHMQGSLNAAQDQISWVITSYIVAAAISLPLTGFLAERYGRKRVIIFAMLGFAATSGLCSSAHTIGEIVAYRALQGFCSAWIVPLSQSALLDAYPHDRQAQAISWWGMGSTLGPLLGPTLGGFLTEHFDWRWVFIINVPFGIVTATSLVFLLRETPRKPGSTFDLLGFSLLACALAALQLLLDRGQIKDWFDSPEIVIEAIVATTTFYLFLVHIFTSTKPFLKLELYRDWNYTVGLLLVFIAAAIPMTTMVLMPLLMQNVMGYPVDTVGILMSPRGGGTLCTMWMVPWLVRVVGARPVVIVGLSLITVSMMISSSFTTNTSESLIFTSAIVQGFGMGFLFMPLNIVMLATVKRSLMTEAAAMANLFRGIGSSVGVSVVMTLLSQNTQAVRAGLTEHITPFSRSVQDMAGRAAASDPRAALAMISGEIDRQAAMTAFVDDFRLLALMTLALVPLLFLFRLRHAQPVTGPAAVAEA